MAYKTVDVDRFYAMLDSTPLTNARIASNNNSPVMKNYGEDVAIANKVKMMLQSCILNDVRISSTSNNTNY